MLITGAASGIGAAATDELRSRGARVVGLDLVGDGPDMIECDVRDQASVDSAVSRAVERLGGLDVLINNAGIGTPQSAGLRPDAGAHAVIEVNLLGPWRVTAAAIPALRESHGRVVNVASGLAHLSVPFAPAYCMSKRGLVAYSDALRLDEGGAVSVTTVYPGYIRTPIHAASQEEGVTLEGIVPVEPVEAAARALARAALGSPVRDLATTRRGALGYALARRAPHRLLDRLVTMRFDSAARDGRFAGSSLAEGLAAQAGTRRRRPRLGRVTSTRPSREPGPRSDMIGRS